MRQTLFVMFILIVLLRVAFAAAAESPPASTSGELLIDWKKIDRATKEGQHSCDYWMQALKEYQISKTPENAARVIIACSRRSWRLDQDILGVDGVMLPLDERNVLRDELTKCMKSALELMETLMTEHPELDPPLGKFYGHLLTLSGSQFARAACLRYLSIIGGYGDEATVINLGVSFGNMALNAPKVGSAISERETFLFPLAARQVTQEDVDGWKKMRELLRQGSDGLKNLLSSDDPLVQRQLRILSENLLAWRDDIRVRRHLAQQEAAIIEQRERDAKERAEAKKTQLSAAMERLQELAEERADLHKLEIAMGSLSHFRHEMKEQYPRVPNYERIEKALGETEAKIINAFYLYIVLDDVAGAAADAAGQDEDYRALILRAYVAGKNNDLHEMKELVEKAIKVNPKGQKAQHMRISLDAMIKEQQEKQ